MTETGEQEIHLDDDDSSVETGTRTRLFATDGRMRTPRLAARWERLDAKRAIVLALVVSVVALTLAMPVRTYFSQRTEFEQLSAGNTRLRGEVTDYQQKVNEQGDPAYIEAKARERLQFVRPGEKAVVMMYPGDDARIAAQKRAEERARSPWFSNLWDAVSTPPGTK
ncbi:FtsB family cell division protein [Gordonia sp. NPDC003424]